MDADLVFLVGYPCPRCHAPLEAPSGRVPTWLRCPHCGRAGLPPEHEWPGRETSEVVPGWGTYDAMDAATATLPIRPRPMAPRPASTAPKAPTSRLVLGSGFFLTTVLCLFALLESNGGRASFFGVAAAVFLFLLTRPVAPTRGTDPGA